MFTGFVANFTRFPAVEKFENWLRFDKVTESLKLGTFLRHSAEGARVNASEPVNMYASCKVQFAVS